MRSVAHSFLAACAIGAALLLAGCSSSSGTGFLNTGDQDGGGGAPWNQIGANGDGGSGSSNGDSGTSPGKDGSTPPPPPQPDSGQPPPPQDSGTDAGQPNDGFDQFQHHNLDVINMYRATLNVAPLVLDKQLCDFALAGSTELSMDHMPHQHFITAGNNGSLWTSGFNSQAGENQGDPNGWTQLSSDPTQNELQQIDAIQAAMFAEGPGSGEAHGHYTNMMNSQYKRLGVGLLEVSGQLYLTNDFSD